MPIAPPIIIDCKDVISERDFWMRYLEATQPQGTQNFGRNIDAFRDALIAGGPGYPGECELHFINMDSVQLLQNGKFYEQLNELARGSRHVPVHIE